MESRRFSGIWFPRSIVSGVTLSLLLVCVMTGVITYGVHRLINTAITTAIKSEAIQEANKWAKYINATSPDLSKMLDDGTLTPEQSEIVQAAIDYNNVYSFMIFDLQGRLIFESDEGVLVDPRNQAFSEEAQGVIQSGEPNVSLIERQSYSTLPDVFINALVPVYGTNDKMIGAIHLFMDKSDQAALFHQFLNWLGNLLPILCALLYSIPSLAFVLKREQSNAKTRHVNHLSRFDHLTGALNRHTMSAEAKKRFALCPANEHIGVMFLDIDKFKTINDENGHEFGDACLHNVASILMGNVRATDLVGRMGGDEFVVAMPDTTHEELERIGKRMLSDARKPFEYKGRTIRSSISIGYRLSPNGETPQTALHCADLALYHAKANGRDAMVEYFPELDVALNRRREIEATMREALVNKRFETVFQPITNPKDNSVIGFEALLRLTSESGEQIPPTEFIPIAEETGLIHELGLQTLRNAIKTALNWPSHVFLSVNMSPRQFDRDDLIEKISAILTELNFPAHRLELEVTESLLMENELRVSEHLADLRHLGISIAMDDFGTGYSSLGYLWKYEFNKLKIDKVFLEGYDFDGERYREIIETIVVLGHKMGMQVTIEGVEDERHTDMLQSLGCDQYQGFLFGKPMAAVETLDVPWGHAKTA
ncbi:bifunctional diguanylate cyclase/phosphodiesterase [Roseovarius aestuarii]|uniref:Cyclic di-GMP phosphodiesterase Gmr n=2 Tax=Roseovarius aestuarii TaxID=475083 RepID=A0A1X7BY02_9RHOB|nr:EAL domain-containing protein [Roseovarius aestuarii]SMC14405.1 Cyclic di-GMP phosphodiesterase Gmr [Roseovarius aestuarii]